MSILSVGKMMGPINAGSGGHIPNPTALSILAKLTSWWELNEASGTRTDSKGTNVLTESGGVIATANGVRGAGDPAAAFPGGRDLVIASNASLQVPASQGSFSLFGWFYANVNSGIQFYIAKYAGSAPTLEYALSQQPSSVFASTPTATASQAYPTAAAWHFYHFWLDTADKKIRLSIDNAAANVSAAASTTAPTASVFAIGGSYNGTPLSPMAGRGQRCGWCKGSFISPTEQAYLYNSGNSVTYAELVAAAS